MPKIWTYAEKYDLIVVFLHSARFQLLAMQVLLRTLLWNVKNLLRRSRKKEISIENHAFTNVFSD